MADELEGAIRAGEFRRNTKLEELLAEVNASLWGCEEKLLLEAQQQPEFHAIFVMGPLRSGTTLFMQWLAATGLVSYPSNLLSRFYQAPIIGAKIQLLLTDARYSFRNELGDFSLPPEYESQNGKTVGALSPNEFWYFWRRFLAEPQRDVWSDDELRDSFDADTMRAELAGVMDVFQQPFAAKGMLFNYNVPYLDSLFDKVLFIHMKRDPTANVASVLNARKRQLGSVDKWYSFKIPEYEQLLDLEPVEQAAGQVHYINKALDGGLATVSDSRKIIVDYEAFCNNPGVVYQQLLDKLGLDTKKLPYAGARQFGISNAVPAAMARQIDSALDSFSQQ